MSDDASDLALSREAWGDALADLAGSTFDTPLTFVKATKVCGDIYVPMGAVTFVALVDPPEAVDALRRPANALFVSGALGAILGKRSRDDLAAADKDAAVFEAVEAA